MKSQYIFVKKPKATINVKNSRKLFQSIFNEIFQNTTFDTFDICHDNVTDTISYKSSTTNPDMYYLVLSHESSPAKDAKLLNMVHKILISGKHRKDFYIINSYDEPSEYYCEKLAPRFGKFERLMRAFIYISLTKSLGFKWFEASFTDEMKKTLKEKGNISDTDLIERGLYEMTFAQLYDYLFMEYSYCSAEYVIYEQLLTQDLNSMDKMELINIINQCKKESLWNRFFINNTEFDLKEPLYNMRDYRNKVAHNKFISTADYNTCTSNLKKINTTLTNAINKLDKDIYTEKHLLDSVMSFSALFAGLLKNNFDIVSSIQKNFSILGETLISALKPVASIQNMENMYKIGSAFSELSKLSIALKSNIPKIEIPDFYQSLSLSKLPDVLDSYDDSLDDEQKDGNSNNDDKGSNENSNSDDKESNGNSNSNDKETE